MHVRRPKPFPAAARIADRPEPRSRESWSGWAAYADPPAIRRHSTSMHESQRAGPLEHCLAASGCRHCRPCPAQRQQGENPNASWSPHQRHLSWMQLGRRMPPDRRLQTGRQTGFSAMSSTSARGCDSFQNSQADPTILSVGPRWRRPRCKWLLVGHGDQQDRRRYAHEHMHDDTHQVAFWSRRQ